MAEPNIRQMFEAGVHFGHQARFWNPKMAPYIYGERNKIHIIDLDTVLPMFKSALDYLKKVGASGGKILFVGTKRAARDSIVKHAQRCGMPYVNHRWLGGMLTNFKTVRLSVKRYTSLEEEREKGGFAKLSKKQALRRDREIIKLSRNIEGIKDMVRLPDAMFVIDVRHEKIAVSEAAKLNIPIIAMVDTNNFFENIDYMVPGNDDAIRAVDLYVSAAADAVLAGVEKKEARVIEMRTKETIKGVIKVSSKAPRKTGEQTEEKAKEKSAQTPAEPARSTLRKTTDKNAGKEGKAKPKVRMRGFGLLKRPKENQAGEKQAGEKQQGQKEDGGAAKQTSADAEPDKN